MALRTTQSLKASQIPIFLTDPHLSREGDTLKKRIWILVALLFVVLLWAAWYFRPAGTIEGPEWDILHVDGITYISESSAGFDIPYDRSDRGMHIGIIRSGDYIFHIYEVKGDPDRNYLYWAWEWEGDMYVREDLADAMKEQEG